MTMEFLDSDTCTMDAPFRGKRHAKRQRVRGELRSMILDGRCPPGARLMQKELAKELGSSVNVIRELLYEFQSVGLVEPCIDSGFSVCRLDEEKLIDGLRVRAALDSLAARLCCGRASQMDVRQLREMATKIYDAQSLGTEEAVKKALLVDQRLHRRIVEIARNDSLSRARQSYWIPTLAFPPEEGWGTNPEFEHVDVIEAIEANRPTDAERLMRKHVEDSLRFVRKQLETGKVEVRWWYV